MNKTSWIIIGITLLICAAIGYFFSYPQVMSTWQTYSNTKKAKTNIQEISTKKEILTNLNKNKQLNNLYDIASKYIPTDPDSSGLILELSAIATQNNLTVEQFSLDTKTNAKSNSSSTSANSSDTTSSSSSSSTSSSSSSSNTDTNTNTSTSNSNISELPFSMTVSGTFTDYLAFLKSLQTSSRLITINAMDLKQDQANFSSHLSGKAYYKKSAPLEQNLANIDITQAIIDRFANLKTYSDIVTPPTESGFGRSNPFQTTQ